MNRLLLISICLLAAAPAWAVRVRLTAGEKMTVTCDPAPAVDPAPGDNPTPKPSASPSSMALGANADLGGYVPFPPDSFWRRDVSADPVDARSQQYIDWIGYDGSNRLLHPDFGTVWCGDAWPAGTPCLKPNGAPYGVIPGTQPKVPVKFTSASESDPGPYPLWPEMPIQNPGGSPDEDHHVSLIDRDNLVLYELYQPLLVLGAWTAESGAVWDLKTGTRIPDGKDRAGWTSVNAAGTAYLPAMVRYDEVARGEIPHALQFTLRGTQSGYLPPCTHQAGWGRTTTTDDRTKLPYVWQGRPTLLTPMCARFRLKAAYDCSVLKAGPNRVICRALKKYGMVLTDNGVDLFLSGAPDARWNDAELGGLKSIGVRDFEVIQHPDPTR